MRETRRLLAAIVAATALIGGCDAATGTSVVTRPGSLEPTSVPAPAGGSPLVEEPPSAGTEVTARPDAPTPVPGSIDALAAGRTAVVAADGLRIRSEPRISDDSRELEPLLSAPGLVYLYAGPVQASGYDWFQVLPLDERYPQGWVAAASRDGEPWIKLDEGGCDSIGPSVTVLANGSPGERLGCSGGAAVTVDARIVDCDVEVDGPPLEPGWFGFNSVQADDGHNCVALVEPDGSQPDSAAPFFAHFDPQGDIPDPLPVNRHVLVTGQFDHPAAQTCRFTPPEGPPPDPVLMCRTTFVITRVAPVR
jgi:hypothetical protein